MIPPEQQPPVPSTPPEERWNDVSVPVVNWGPMDVVVATTVTMLTVIAILSLGEVIGDSVGFATSVAAPVGYYLGALGVGLALILLRITRSPIWPVMLAIAIAVGVIGASYVFGTDVGNGVAELAGVPVGIISATVMSGAFAATGISFSIVLFRVPFSALGFVKTKGFKPYVFAVGIWLIGLTVLLFWVQALIWLGVDALLPPDTAKKALDEAGGSIVITIVLVGVLGPIAEEIFFRGYVLPGLVKRFGVAPCCYLHCCSACSISIPGRLCPLSHWDWHSGGCTLKPVRSGPPYSLMVYTTPWPF